jgi:signal transduction histidine kinase
MIHVLYVEDDLVVASMVKACFGLVDTAFELEIELTGRGGLARLARGGIDVLLLDLELPDTNGLRILGELSTRGDSTPVIMVSGRGQTELAVKALRAGAVDCVDKASPQFFQIVEVVRRVHERHQAQREGLAAAPDRPERHGVWLVEQSRPAAAAMAAFLAESAPQLDVTVLTTAPDLDRAVQAGLRADAVLIGSPPAGTDPFDLLRKLRSLVADLPVILLAARNDAEAAVAAFKLGAQDYILQSGDYLAQVVFSLGHAINRHALARRNVQLQRELAVMNRSLEAQVEARTGELHALSLRLLRVQEQERRHIAQELHDQIGQMLTGLKLQLEAAVPEAAPAGRSRLDEARVLAQELLERTRKLTLQLRPRLLDDLGLKPATEWHLELFQRQTGIAVGLECSLPPGRLPAELELTVFRLVQEALTNVARHAGCTAAQVAIVAGEAELLVEITDRGRGFDLERGRAKHDSLGLAGMAERVQLAGGVLELSSRPGQGTRVHASFPRPRTEPAP